jgi:hypothetical protein
MSVPVKETLRFRSKIFLNGTLAMVDKSIFRARHLEACHVQMRALFRPSAVNTLPEVTNIDDYQQVRKIVGEVFRRQETGIYQVGRDGHNLLKR